MANDLVKRFIKKDGSQRISFYREDYPENPRRMTDEPLHCQDWSREYSIELKDERDNSYLDARSLLINLLCEYGKREVIINMLVENGKHMTDGKSICNNALIYDRSLKGWELKEYTKWYSEKGYDWHQAQFFDGRKDDIDLYQLLEMCLDSTIDELQYFKYWTDGVKICSYGFGYNGEIYFDENGISCESEGIAWLEKDEFLKYSGCSEEVWKSKTLSEIEFLLKEIKAWSEGEVYGFSVEKAVETVTSTHYPNGEHEDFVTKETLWEDVDSCWGFYGDIDDVEDYMFEQAGLNKEDFEEKNV